jgi:exoribonuclease-2
MLPLQFSTDRTSLNENEDRRALVADMTIGADGSVATSEIYRALVRNKAQLTYNAVAAWMDGSGPPPAAIARVPGLDAQLRLQERIAELLQKEREALGALDFDRSELHPIVDDTGVKDLETEKPSRAKLLIENFMIASNGSAVRFLNSKGFPSVRRVVRSPERWSRIVDLAERHGGKLPPDPDAPALQQFLKDQQAKSPTTFPDLSIAIIKLLGRGEYVAAAANEPSAHFALAAHEYSHATAPNRRYADILEQRLLKAAIAGAKPPYAIDQLSQLAQHCTDREDAANKVERLTKKAAAALWLGDRIGQTFDAIVTGAGSKGTWVRLIAMPVEGRLARGGQGLDVGDRVRVQLVSTDPPRGFIDFARIS